MSCSPVKKSTWRNEPLPFGSLPKPNWDPMPGEVHVFVGAPESPSLLLEAQLGLQPSQEKPGAELEPHPEAQPPQSAPTTKLQPHPLSDTLAACMDRALLSYANVECPVHSISVLVPLAPQPVEPEDSIIDDAPHFSCVSDPILEAKPESEPQFLLEAELEPAQPPEEEPESEPQLLLEAEPEPEETHLTCQPFKRVDQVCPLSFQHISMILLSPLRPHRIQYCAWFFEIVCCSVSSR